MYICICMHAYVYIYIYVYTHACVYPEIHIYIHTHACVYIHMLHIYIWAHENTYVDTCVKCIYIYIYLFTSMFTSMYIIYHTDTRTHKHYSTLARHPPPAVICRLAQAVAGSGFPAAPAAPPRTEPLRFYRPYG